MAEITRSACAGPDGFMESGLSWKRQRFAFCIAGVITIVLIFVNKTFMGIQDGQTEL